MLKVGVTGNIGSGKSLVARIFNQLGIPVYNSDERAKAIMTEDKELVEALRALTGKETYTATGELDRTFLASRIFGNAALLAGVNALVHPAVFRDFDKWVTLQTTPYVIKEAALLYESGSYKTLDKMIVVSAPEALRVQRSMERDNATRGQVVERMSKQMSQEEKEKKADHVLRNDESELLIPQVLKLHENFLAITR